MNKKTCMFLFSIALSAMMIVQTQAFNMDEKSEELEVTAETVMEEGEGYTYDTQTDTLTIQEVNNSLGVTCPEQYREKVKNVVIKEGTTMIGVSAFEECTNLTTISIPNSVKTVLDHAFYHCKSLVKVEFPKKMEEITTSFSGCTNLQHLSLPEEVDEFDVSFQNCSSLKSVALPNNMTAISYGMFENCTRLSSIVIPESVTRIGTRAFSGCTALTSVTMGKNIAEIEDCAFVNCSNLTSIKITAINPEVGLRVFEGCSKLVVTGRPGTVKDSAEMEGVGFKALPNMIAVSFYHYNLDYPNASCVQYYTKGEKLGQLPELYRTVYDKNKVVNYIFQGWYTKPKGGKKVNLTEDTVCKGKASYYARWARVKIGSPIEVDDTVWKPTKKNEITLVKLAKSEKDLIKPYVYRLPAVVNIEDVQYKINVVGTDAFKNCKRDISQIILHKNVKTVEKKAFSGMPKLETIDLGSGVKNIGSKAFSGCKKLKTIKISSSDLSDKTLAKDAFLGIGNSVVIQVKKKDLKKYKKMFVKHGLSKKVKVKAC